MKACVPQRVSVEKKMLGESMLEFKGVRVVSCCQSSQLPQDNRPHVRGMIERERGVDLKSHHIDT